MVNEHVSACRGGLRTEFPRPKRFATKMVVFAKAECVVGDLGGIQGIGDIPPRGVVLRRGDPICTVHRIGDTRDLSATNARDSVVEVYNRTHLL
jgi:hypothetical protein